MCCGKCRMKLPVGGMCVCVCVSMCVCVCVCVLCFVCGVVCVCCVVWCVFCDVCCVCVCVCVCVVTEGTHSEQLWLRVKVLGHEKWLCSRYYFVTVGPIITPPTKSCRLTCMGKELEYR